MKKMALFLLLSVAPLGFIQAQSNPDKCNIVEDSLDDKKRFEKALKCKSDIKDNHPLYPVKTDSSVVYVVTLSNSGCKKFKNEEGLWVTLLPELQDVYQTKHGEFGQVENRLKKLIGLNAGDTYKCLTVLETTYDSLKRPEKGTSGYPYTGRGFTCDWYYGDGCRYGLSEFILMKKAEKFVSYEINNCSIISKEINDCWIENILGERCPVK